MKCTLILYSEILNYIKVILSILLNKGDYLISMYVCAWTDWVEEENSCFSFQQRS